MYGVVESKKQFKGYIFEVVTDRVEMPDGSVATRDVAYKTGAVIVVPVDSDGSVVMVRQYRHAVRGYLWELPAGLLDVEGEDPSATALRELAEETDLTAARVEHLVDIYTSPGFTNEKSHVFLARDLSEIPLAERHHREAEEADMQIARFPMAKAIEMIFAGEITNAGSVIGILAAHVKLRD